MTFADWTIAGWIILGMAVASVMATWWMQFGVWVARRRGDSGMLASEVAATNGRDTPGITVLKPLKGREPELYENLASIAEQRYPSFEIIFGAEDPFDPALVEARRVQKNYPHVSIRIVAGIIESGLNPKVSLVSALSRLAAFDWVLISDSNVRADRDYLTKTFAATFIAASDARCAHAAGEVGLVSSLLVGTGERNLGALLDNLHMNTFVARAVCTAQSFVHHPCVVGKSMLFRRSVLDRLGGWDVARDVLAEDYVLGQLFHKNGYYVALSTHPLPAMSIRRSVRDFMCRHLRWSQMRRRINPVMYLFEPLSFPHVWLSLAIVWLLAREAPVPAVVHWAVGIAGLATVVADIDLLVRSKRRAPLAVQLAVMLLKDWIVLGIWAIGLGRRSVTWRGTAFLVTEGSRLTPARAPELRRAVELS